MRLPPKILGLIFCSLLWSGVYSMSKGLMGRYHPMEIAFLRYLTAGVPLLMYCALARPKNAKRPLLWSWLRDLRRMDLRIVIVGALAFFISPFCQMTGLHRSSAIDGSLVIATEPLFTIAAACVLLGERLRRIQVVSIALAIAGVGVLADVTFDKLLSFKDARLTGDLIMIGSMFSDASYSAIAKPALDRRSPTLFMTVAIWIGIALLFGYNLAVDGPERLAGLTPLFTDLRLGDFAAFAYLGLGCTLFAYLYWMVALTSTPVSVMALTLYAQPLLGPAWGYFFLHESITISTFAGGFLILAALWLGVQPRRG